MTGADDRGIALGALVLAVVPLVGGWIASVVLALVVLRRRRRGRGLALTALGVVGCWLVLLAVGGVVALWVSSDHGHAHPVAAGASPSPGGAGHQPGDQATDTPKPHGRNGDVSLFDLRVGDCLWAEPPDDAETARLVPCRQPHRAEVYAVFQLDIDPPARQREIDRLADGGCMSRFAVFVGTPYSESPLGMTNFAPVAANLRHDHEVTCLVLPETGRVTGSLKAPES